MDAITFEDHMWHLSAACGMDGLEEEFQSVYTATMAAVQVDPNLEQERRLRRLMDRQVAYLTSRWRGRYETREMVGARGEGN